MSRDIAKPRRNELARANDETLTDKDISPVLDFGHAWDYAPSLETTDHVKIQPRYELFIDGKWRAPKSGKYFDTISPSTEQKLSEIAEASAADVDLAVTAARNAYENVWSKMRPAERAKYIFRISRAIQEKARELAIVESLDGGKPIKESRDVDIPLAAAHFFYHGGWADKLGYAFHGRRPRPLGVAGQIIPWNFPLLMAAWKIAPALACGNTVVLKPAETTSLTALMLAKIFEEAELPPGVVNIITGAGETGAALVNHPGVDKIAFTGSTEVGKKIQRALAGSKKRLTLELGGKAANIIFQDAPIDQAVEGIVRGIYFNQGHVCCAGSRLLVEESIHDLIVRKLKDRLATLRLGDPLDKNTDVGAINSKMHIAVARLLVRADIFHGREPIESHRTRRNFRSGTDHPHVSHPRRSARKSQQHDVRPLGRNLDRQRREDFLDGAAPQGRRDLGKHVQQVRSVIAVRRLQRERLRSRRRTPRSRRLRGARRLTCQRNRKPRTRRF